MEPNYKMIADLFAAPQPIDLVIEEGPRTKEGKDAAQSDELGRQCLVDGDHEGAVRHFRRAVEQREAHDVASRIDLAGAYDFADQAPQALRQYEKALRLNAEAVEPIVGISDLYRRYGRFRDAIEKLEAATEKEPQNAYLKIKLAETLRDAGERKRALTVAQQAILVKPDDAFTHYWIGDLLIQMGEYEDALLSIRAAIELSPGDDHLYVRAAVAFWRAGRQAEAVKSIRLASDLDPSKHVYHGLLGVLLDEMGQREDASQESVRAAKMDRYDEDTLARLMEEMGVSD